MSSKFISNYLHEKKLYFLVVEYYYYYYYYYYGYCLKECVALTMAFLTCHWPQNSKYIRKQMQSVTPCMPFGKYFETVTIQCSSRMKKQMTFSFLHFSQFRFSMASIMSF